MSALGVRPKTPNAVNTLAKLWFTTGLAICTMLSSLVLWGAIHHALRYDAPFNPRMLPFLSIAAILAFSFAMMVRKAQREYLHGALSHGIITKENEEERSRVFLDNLWNVLQDGSMALSAGICADEEEEKMRYLS